MAKTPTSNPTQGVALFLSVPEVARRLGIGQTSTWALIRDKELPCAHIGRRALVPVAALAEFAARLTSMKR